MSFLRDSGGAAVLQILAVGLQFAAGVMVARGLDSGGKGIHALVVLIPDMARAFAHMGFGTACTRQIVKKPAFSGRITANLIIFALVVSAVFCLGLFSAFPHLQRFVETSDLGSISTAGGDLAQGIALAIFGLPLLLLEGFLSNALVGRRAILAANLSKVVQTGSFALLVPVFFTLDEVSVVAAVKAWALSFVLGDLLALFALLLVLQGPRRPDRRLAKNALAFGLKAFPASIMVYLLLRIDVVLLRIWGDSTEELGVYSIAASLAMMFQIIGFSVERALVPRLMSRSGAETAILTPIATRSFLILGVPLAAASALAAWPMVPIIFGAQYAGAVLPLALILPGIVIGNIGQITNTDLLGRGYPGYASIAALLALASNLGLNYFLIPRYGIVGAGFASLVSYTIFGLVLTLVYRRLTGVPVREVLIPKAEDLKRILRMIRRGR